MTRFQSIARKTTIFGALYLLVSIGIALAMDKRMQADVVLLGAFAATAVYFLLSLLMDRSKGNEPNA